ncbi:hypothetical protein DV737_g4044, partial [Chaetothyriales sp. CBS 132003]
MATAQVDYIYKIVPAEPVVPVTDAGQLPPDYSLPVSDLDRQSGFVHMSTAAQIPNTLKFFFGPSSSSRDSVYLLRVPYQALEERKLVRWESPDAKICGPRYGEGMFPHIYDKLQFKLTHEEVDSVKEVVSQPGDDSWDAALSELKRSGWLV